MMETNTIQAIHASNQSYIDCLFIIYKAYENVIEAIDDRFKTWHKPIESLHDTEYSSLLNIGVTSWNRFIIAAQFLPVDELKNFKSEIGISLELGRNHDA
jgi:hypothetical protein